MAGQNLMAMAVVAHRGCPRHAPENSLAGIRAAARLGAGVVELDVRLTGDGVPVLVHDPLLRRTTGRWAPVRVVRASALRTMALRGGDGEAPPTLEAALRALPPGLDAALDIKVAGALAATLAAVDRAGARARVRLWSQHERVVAGASAAGVVREVALLRDTSTAQATLRLLDRAVDLGASAVSLHPSVVDRDLVEVARDRGLLVYSWAQRVADLDALVDARPAGIVTDFVEEAVAAVARAS